MPQPVSIIERLSARGGSVMGGSTVYNLLVQCVMLYVLSSIRAFLGPVIGGVLVQLVGFPSMAAVRNG